MIMYENLNMITCGHDNCYVIKGEKGDILIDTGSSEWREPIETWLENYNVTLIILTHGHIDHVGNAGYFSGLYKAPVMIHEDDLSLAQGKRRHFYVTTPAGKMIKAAQEKSGNAVPDSFSNVIYAHDGMSLSEYGIDGEIIGLEGHTRGSIGVMHNSSLGLDLYAGDAVMNMPLSMFPAICESPKRARESINRISRLIPVRIMPGHGDPLCSWENKYKRLTGGYRGISGNILQKGENDMNISKIIPAAVIALTLTACAASGTAEETSADVSKAVTESLSETVSADTSKTDDTAADTVPAPQQEENEETAYDRAIRLAAEYIEEHGWEHDKFVLYDFDLDGIPELMEEKEFKDAMGWEIHKLTGSEAVSLGDIMYAAPSERYEDGINSLFYHGDELTLESGVHIYRDNEKDKTFYVTEYIGEGHTEGAAVGLRYEIYTDKLAERELYHCDFLTLDDCGASGNRYIIHNILDGKKAAPMYRCDCNSEGFLYCNEFGDYLSSFEYLGMIDVTNCYTKENGSSFYDYAEMVKIPEKTKDERVYSDEREKVTVCGNEYYADAYEANVVIDNDNFDSIDLSELKLLPCLERLTLLNKSDRTADISKLAELENLSEIYFSGGEFDYSRLPDMDNIIRANAPIEYISQMKSIKIVSAYPYTDEIDGFAPLYDMKELEVVLHTVPNADESRKIQLDRLAERRPDLLLIYVP